MIVKELKRKVFDLSEEIALQEGLEVVEVEITGGPGRYVVRVYIDRESGVTISDCASFSRYLGTILEVDDPIPTSYFLEVSSPGVDRVLRKPAHFERYLGKRVNIRFENSIEGRRKITGKISGVTDSFVEVEVEEKRLRVDYDNIKKARLKASDSILGKGVSNDI